MHYHFKIHKEGNGYWAECIELPGCFTQADSREELQKNMEMALNLYIEEQADSKELAELPDENIKSKKNVIAVAVDQQIAFAFMVRYWRITNGWTQKEVAKKLGFDTLYSYQRLEKRGCNPSLKILSMIKKLYPHFSVDRVINS